MSRVVAVAFSGGLDTSWLVARYAERGDRVIAITVDTGGWTDEGRTALAAHADRLGAAQHLLIDGRDALYRDHIAWLIRGNVLRGAVYPLCVGVERVVQAILFAQAARDRGAELLVHGSTGAGNDQIRFDVALRTILPEAEIEAPIRDEAVSREHSMAWLAERGLGPMQADPTLSINRGLWGTTAGGGVTHDPWAEPGPDAYTTTVDPALAPPEGTCVVIGFAEGLPVSINGEALDGWRAVEALHDIGADHGIGRGIHLGDTILGIKGRVVFEAPAAEILITAHRELEKLVLTSAQRNLKDQLGELYGQLVHEARGLDPVARDIEALLGSSQQRVTGDVRVRLRQGAVEVTGVRSPFSMMDVQKTAYGEHTALWSGVDARGFARIHGVPAYLAARASGV